VLGYLYGSASGEVAESLPGDYRVQVSCGPEKQAGLGFG
jgi:hypothetical protein